VRRCVGGKEPEVCCSPASVEHDTLLGAIKGDVGHVEGVRVVLDGNGPVDGDGCVPRHGRAGMEAAAWAGLYLEVDAGSVGGQSIEEDREEGKGNERALGERAMRAGES
jgi:hypothetical protein